MTLDAARDLWAARYGYEWQVYTTTPPSMHPVMEDPFWHAILKQLRDNACMDINYVTGYMRLKEWKS